MRIAKLLEVAGAILVSTLVMGCVAVFAANDNSHNSAASQPIRLAYSSSWMRTGQKSSPKICLSVWPDGRYRILRQNDMHQNQLLQGIMSDEQRKELASRLDAPGFRALSGTRGGLLRQGSESFIAEVPRQSGLQRLLWMIPDGQSRFSKPVADIVDWLRDFQPKGARTLLPTDFPDVCPQVGMSAVTPVVASKRKATSPNSCTIAGREAESLP